MPTIVFATDLSAADRDSLQLACIFAKAWKAKLLILHADNSQKTSPQADLPPRLDPKHKLHELFPSDVDIDYDYVLQSGEPAKLIRDVEQARDVDLIVLGTHGRKGMERLFAGSVAEGIIRSAKCPVLTVRHHKRSRLFEYHAGSPRILVPTDFSPQSHAALAFASSIRPILKANITVLHVDESPVMSTARSPKENSKTMEQHANLLEQLKRVQSTDPGIGFDHVILRGRASELISQYANKQRFDFVVVGTHGRRGIRRALLGSVAEDVVRNADCPVICVKLNNKQTPKLGTKKRRRASSTTH
jgi:nucleotide-binding universal stress UspA family protein